MVGCHSLHLQYFIFERSVKIDLHGCVASYRPDCHCECRSFSTESIGEELKHGAADHVRKFSIRSNCANSRRTYRRKQHSLCSYPKVWWNEFYFAAQSSTMLAKQYREFRLLPQPRLMLHKRLSKVHFHPRLCQSFASQVITLLTS